MKITYRREMKHNYLIINPDIPEYKGFESQMLEKNSIEGLLEFHIKSLDGQRSCYYEITSKQSLSRILEYKSLGEEELRTLIGGIARTLSRLEAYLLYMWTLSVLRCFFASYLEEREPFLRR